MRRTTCRVCDSSDLHVFLDLDETPLADALVRPEHVDDEEEQFPLEVVFCADCALVQLLADVPAEKLFVDNYLYFSSFSDHLLRHSRDHALSLIDDRGLTGDDFVVELASNDGYLLKNFLDRGVPVLGIDPAPDQAEAANAAGVPTVAEFFGVELAERIVADRGHADVVLANNVMAHVPDLNDFVGGMAVLLADDGVIHVENPYVADLIEHCEFDTIYHEHIAYWSCTAVDHLVQRHGLFLNDVEYFPELHGGTLRWHIGHHEQQSDAIRQRLDDERAVGMDTIEYYTAFSDRVRKNRDALRQLLEELRAEGRTVAAYGAAAKGATLLNYVGITTDLVEFVVDRNQHKQGLCMPGTHQPIRDPQALLDEQPDYVLLLAWNFKDEIMAQQQAYLDAGGQFIVPVPTPEICA